MVQWLGLSVFTATAWVQSLVKELRSRKLHGTTKIKVGWGGEELEKVPRWDGAGRNWRRCPEDLTPGQQEFKMREKELPWQFSG